MVSLVASFRTPFTVTLLLALAVPAIGQDAPVTTAPASVAPATQTGAQDAASSWLYKGSDITPDPEWHFGVLPNGVRWATRKNGVPPGQVSIRVRIDAGSLMETDNEQGYAHLLEHLSFRGSRYVADGEAKRTWQRLGATFGSDTNAQTTPTGTVFKLDLPSATQAGVDESVRILSGMMAGPIIDKPTVDTERPVVLAEQREQPGPQVRLSDLTRATFFAGQPLANRSPIGTVKTLNAATAESVKAFHDRWYRPERAVVVISGDIDPTLASQIIAKSFSDWKGIGPEPKADFGQPNPNAPAAAALVEPGLPTLVSYGVIRPFEVRDDTVIYNQRRLVDMLAIRLINRRLETRARAGGSFLQAGVGLDDVSRSANVTSVQILPVGDDWESALRDVRAVIADALVRAPRQDEIDRELTEFDAAMKAEVDTQRVEAGSKEADDLVQAVDIRETVASAQTAYDILQGAKAKKMFTAAALLASTKKVFTGVATRAVVNIHTADDGVVTKLATDLKSDVSKLAGKRTEQGKVTFARLPKLGAPATVVSNDTLMPGLDDMRQITFSNGVKLMLWANDAETGRVYVRVRFGGGYNALPADHPTPAWAGELALVASGIGKLGQDDLDAMTTGRRIGFDFDIGEDAFSFGGQTSPQDYKDELQLFAAKLAEPGWDPKPVERAKAVVRASQATLSASPDGVLSRDLEKLLRSNDPRWGQPSPETIDATTPAAFRAFWEPILATGPIEVEVFGNVKADEAIAAVASTLGALKPRAPVALTPPPVTFPAHNTAPVVRTHNGDDNQAAAIIAWPTGAGIDGIGESRQLDVLAAIFTDRLFDRLRNAAGVSYSPNVGSQWPIALPGGGRIVGLGQVPPEKVGFYFTLARQIAAELVATPVTQDELDRELKPMIQAVLRASTGNQFWMNQMQGATYDPRRIAAARAVKADLEVTTPASLQALAQKYLRPEADWTMAVVPKSYADKGGSVAPVPLAAMGPAAVTPSPAAAPAPKPARKAVGR